MGFLGNIGGIKDFTTLQSLQRLEREIEDVKKSLSTLLRNNAPTARLAAAGDSYAYTTDGTRTTTASGADTLKFRSANSFLTVAVENDNATHGDNLLLTVNGSAFGGDPTVSVGLTAVNGTATTFIRSNGAPALSQSIAPTWSGAHVWTSSASVRDDLFFIYDPAAPTKLGQIDVSGLKAGVTTTVSMMALAEISTSGLHSMCGGI